VPGAVSVRSVERRAQKYGTEHPLFYRSRVRGISPTESALALVKLEWVRRAQARYGDPTYMLGLPALGVDVARSDTGDEGGIARGQGRTLLEVETFPCPNPLDLGIRVAREMVEKAIRDEHVGVDVAGGYGGGTVDKLKERERYVKALNAGSKAVPDNSEEEYNHLGSQMWWRMAEDLRNDEIALPDDPELVEQLIDRLWSPKNGKVTVERKEDYQKRIPGGKSPTKADCAVYWNWVRSREPLAAQLGRRGLTNEQQVWAEGLGQVVPDPFQHEPSLGQYD
jgi:hypothetical protein